ncbi:MAG: hypothetical protein WAV78_50795, partial [Xanthobacteraceae bacterium]
MMTNMDAAFDERVRADENMILDNDILSFRLIHQADASFVGVRTVYANKRSNVAVGADPHACPARIDLGKPANVDVLPDLRLADNPDEGMKSVLGHMRGVG